MTYLTNNPDDFVAESLSGFTKAFPHLVRPVDGGVVRSSATPQGEVAIVIGGGSGHYPAFAGLVGQGLAHGAAVGNVFASPSTQQIIAVAKAAENGGGVLFTYGNYAGDVLNFNAAQDALRAEGIACESVIVADDIASAPADQWQTRRGVAGDLAVFKAAGYAAAEGHSLEQVVAIAELANSHTHTLGIAFSGCTLPGATAPLFEVPEGMMEVGLGIHGEPGLERMPRGSAQDIAQLLVSRLLAERIDGVDDVAVILSGLGSVKYEELFVLFGHVHTLLSEAGLGVVEPEVGELVTSFEMAGLSLTLHYLHPSLAEAWSASAYTPAYRKGSTVLAPAVAVNDEALLTSTPSVEVEQGSPESQASSAVIVEAIKKAEATVIEHADHLGQVDAVAGDGDHGIGMKRGISAAATRAESLADSGAGVRTVLMGMADAWSDHAGGTSGAIWGVILRALGDNTSDIDAFHASALEAGLLMASTRVQEFGGAHPGDKTIVDALEPLARVFSETLAAGQIPGAAWEAAAIAAEEAAEATKDMVAHIGRSRIHAEKSLGTPDPGALSLSLIARALVGTQGAQ